MWRLTCLITFAIISLCSAHNAIVLFSFSVSDRTVPSIVKASSKTLFLGVKDFTLPQFYLLIGAYSAEPAITAFTQAIRMFNYHEALPIIETLQVPRSETPIKDGKSSNSNVKYLKISSMGDLEKLIAQKINLSDYNAVIISSQDAFSDEEILLRHKRVSSDVIEEEAEKSDDRQQPIKSFNDAATQLPMPVVLPPYGVKDSPVSNPGPSDLCLLYLEGINLIVHKIGTSYSRNLVVNDNNGANKFGWSKNYVTCAVNNATSGTASFVVDIILGTEMAAGDEGSPDFKLPKGQRIVLQLDFDGVQKNGYWSLAKITSQNKLTIKQGGFLEKDLTIEGGQAISLTDLGIGSVYQYCYACSETPSFRIGDDKDWAVGIGFNNIEVDMKMLNGQARFGWLVSDCIGSFSAGSWMGIIAAVVFGSILLFGYLMLQSIQTLDRFDDPKQKPITINFKE